jgi:hypothetical protein
MNGVCPLLIQFRPQENAALVLPLRAPLLVAPLGRLLARRGSGAAQWQGAAGASNGSGGLSGAVTSATVSSLAFNTVLIWGPHTHNAFESLLRSLATCMCSYSAAGFTGDCDSALCALLRLLLRWLWRCGRCR